MAEKEYIERDKLIGDGWYLQRHVYGKDYACIESRDIRDIPAADVRPVVLCRDCVMYECHEYDGGLKYVCRLFKRQMQETDFCSYGEKMEES